MEKEYEIKLTYEELVLLDKQNIRKKTQEQINDIKLQQSFGFPYPIMNEILFKSFKKGKLTWHYKQMHYCQLCKKENSYKCFACHNDKWGIVTKGFNFSGDETITYECTNCGNIETRVSIDRMTNEL